MPPKTFKQTASKKKQVNFKLPPKNQTPTKNIVTHHRKSNFLTQSMQDLPFRNHLIKKNLASNSSHKTISKFSTTAGEQNRPNGQYYGGETSIFSIKKHRSADVSQRNLSSSRLKHPNSKEKSLIKMISHYRKLQEQHRQEMRERQEVSSQRELHRLAKIQQIQLRQAMEKIIAFEEKSWRK